MINENDKLMSLIDTLCKVSMCDPIEETDFGHIDSLSPGDSETERFVIEFGVKQPIINVSVGQHIKVDDIIAYMSDIPVRAKFCGVITEVADRYIIGIYETNVDDILAMYNLSENMTEQDLLKQFNINV